MSTKQLEYPEWNDLIFHKNYKAALKRLLKTNNFPEFTSRVCPALCEAACTCGLNGNPVTVRENENALLKQLMLPIGCNPIHLNIVLIKK